MNRRHFVLALLILAAKPIRACTCSPSRPFVHVAARSTSVFVAKVVRYIRDDRFTNPIAMEVEVVKLIRGEDPGRKLVIRGDGGKDCGPYVTKFPIESLCVFAVNLPPSPKPCETHIVDCQLRWAQVENGRVRGIGRETLTLEELDQQIREAAVMAGAA